MSSMVGKEHKGMEVRDIKLVQVYRDQHEAAHDHLDTTKIPKFLELPVRVKRLVEQHRDLLTALEEIVGTVGNGYYTPYEVVAQARAAIDKAKGE